MADLKITQLTENTTPITTDIIAMVDDPAGVAVTQKVTLANLPISTATQTALDLKSATSHTHTGVYEPVKGSDDNYVTDAEKVVIGNTSGTNTGDQDITVKANIDSPTFTQQVIVPTGNENYAPVKFVSGVNTSTAVAGAQEYDGTVFYSSHIGSARGVNVSEQLITLTAAYTLPGQGPGLRAMFNAPTNGAITLKSSTAYFFECTGSLTSLSATSGTYSFGFLGTASTTSLRYFSLGNKGAATPVAAVMTNAATSASTAIVAASTTTTGQFYVTGKVVVDTGGTLIPAIGNSAEANPIIGVDSFFKIYPIGVNTVQSVGNWS